MSLLKSFGKPTYKTFKEFLRESNYGSLEKDERLMNIYNDIINFLIYKLKRMNNIDEKETFWFSNLSIKQKHKNELIKQIDIEIVFNISKKNRYYKYFCEEAYIKQISNSAYQLGMAFNQYLGESDKQFIGKIINFLEEDSEEYILHELKHILDMIDEKFDETHVYFLPTPENIKSGKYHSQKQEIQNMLISVISDLKKIKKENPDITYSDAVKKSDTYAITFDKLPVSYHNRIKAKLVDFWYKNYTV